MSSVQSYGEICNKCGHPTESSDFYYKTGEVWNYCASCGIYNSGFMQRSGRSYVREDNECPLDGSYVIGVMDLAKGGLAWTMPITKDMDNETLERFLSRDESLYEKMNIPLPKGYISSVFHLENEQYEKSIFIGDAIHIEMADGASKKLILQKAVWDISNRGGYGVIYMVSKKKEIPIIDNHFDKVTGKEEALKLWSFYEADYVDLVRSYLTIWDEESKCLQVLKGNPDHSFET